MPRNASRLCFVPTKTCSKCLPLKRFVCKTLPASSIAHRRFEYRTVRVLRPAWRLAGLSSGFLVPAVY